MKFTRPLAAGVAAGLAVSVFGAVAPASADPVSASYVLVGSDTLQDSLNAITNGTTLGGSNVRAVASGASVGNFDAFGSALIQTKPNGPYYVRPQGSGNGRNALIASITGAAWNGKTISGQVDIARSSSGPSTNADPAGDLLYVPYGRDAVAYAYFGSGDTISTLTTAELKHIYEADNAAAATVTRGGDTVQLFPMIPQSGSGTRDFFLQAIGVTAANLGDFVNSKTNTLPENDGSQLTTAGQVVPFSAASWIAQKNGASGVNTIPGSGDVKLGSPNNVAPYTGTTTLTPSSAFYAGSYGRDTYVIVEYARVNSGDSKYDAALAGLVNPSNAASLSNFGTLPSTSGAVKRRFGFLPVADPTPIRAYPTVY